MLHYASIDVSTFCCTTHLPKLRNCNHENTMYVCVGVCAHQRTEKVHCLQNELLVADSRNAQILELLMCDSQKLLAAHLLLLKVLDVLLKTVIQTLERPKNEDIIQSGS